MLKGCLESASQPCAVEDVRSEILSDPKCGQSHDQRGFGGSVACSYETSSPCELGGGEDEVLG